MFITLVICWILSVASSSPLPSPCPCSQPPNAEYISTQSQSSTIPVNLTYVRALDRALSTLDNPNPSIPTYNKCAALSNQLINTTTSSAAICPWAYECDYDERRFPPHIFHAKCKNPGKELGITDGAKCHCKEIYQNIKVIKYSGCDLESGEDQWRMENYLITVGCVCLQTT